MAASAFNACSSNTSDGYNEAIGGTISQITDDLNSINESFIDEKEEPENENYIQINDSKNTDTVSVYEALGIPEYSGELYVTVSGNVPDLNKSDGTEDFEIYPELDDYGRCGTCYANVSVSTMPYEAREDISFVHPSGWVQAYYEDEDLYLWNRCHLIAFCLTGQNANEKNLITGTDTFNKDGMWHFEEIVQDYCIETGNHVLYRVTPWYTGSNLVADGVQIEAISVENETIEFNVFVYNVQPGIKIDYTTGESCKDY